MTKLTEIKFSTVAHSVTVATSNLSGLICLLAWFILTMHTKMKVSPVYLKYGHASLCFSYLSPHVMTTPPPHLNLNSLKQSNASNWSHPHRLWLCCLQHSSQAALPCHSVGSLPSTNVTTLCFDNSSTISIADCAREAEKYK
jgi:hypothetical protein